MDGAGILSLLAESDPSLNLGEVKSTQVYMLRDRPSPTYRKRVLREAQSRSGRLFPRILQSPMPSLSLRLHFTFDVCGSRHSPRWF